MIKLTHQLKFCDVLIQHYKFMRGVNAWEFTSPFNCPYTRHYGAISRQKWLPPLLNEESERSIGLSCFCIQATYPGSPTVVTVTTALATTTAWTRHDYITICNQQRRLSGQSREKNTLFADCRPHLPKLGRHCTMFVLLNDVKQIQIQARCSKCKVDIIIHWTLHGWRDLIISDEK